MIFKGNAALSRSVARIHRKGAKTAKKKEDKMGSG